MTPAPIRMREVRSAAVAMNRSGEMLADPRLGEAERFEIAHQLEIALHAERDILVIGVMGGQEHACPHMALRLNQATSPRAILAATAGMAQHMRDLGGGQDIYSQL
jgi:hypothetical protein